MAKQQIKYEEAIAKIEKIIDELESQSLDIDTLTSKVSEASELIEFCRKRLTETDKSIEKILNEKFKD